MSHKVLIANRGAIAVRILRTLKAMQIPAVVVYAESDAHSLHVRLADEACSLGDGPATETYLHVEKMLDVAAKTGATAIHPGYGFLSENAAFVRRCEQAGIIFIGPTAEQIEMFGLKHRARALAQSAGVPLLPGSELLKDLEQAREQAHAIGYPVMLKSTAGGGGIGMQVCEDDDALCRAFESVKRLGSHHFSDDGVFIEKFIARARHIEVQVFGDGHGQAVALGERDCSCQRRNQKVVEECPAPGLSEQSRQQLHDTATRLVASVEYRNAGTVEFIYDADSDDFYFLEVNTRLQVEHGVTEAVYGVDLVAWMVQLATGTLQDVVTAAAKLTAQGHAVQVRLYAEDPYRDFQPAPGLLTDVVFPEHPGVRVDTWVEAGVDIPPYFDPMIAKLIVQAAHRPDALALMQSALETTHLYGTETNLDYLRALLADDVLQQGRVTTRYLNDFYWRPSRIDVLQGGTQTTLQDYPGRTGYWHVGVPPSGPFDDYAFRLGQRLLGNTEAMAGLEMTMQGPVLQFSTATRIVLCGAEFDARLDQSPVPFWQVLEVQPGQVLDCGRVGEHGARAYLCVQGGIDCPTYLGSRATFTLGQFGGHNGRALRTGDVLHYSSHPLRDQRNLPADDSATENAVTTLPDALRPVMEHHWQLRVIYGPHGAPDFFTADDIDMFFTTDWEVHYNSSRTGVRLIGPKPAWARQDGGEAGLHPSNIHDNAYAFGTVDFTGDMPVILGPDGPSLGGFVCPATVIQADLWKLGQLRAGDTVRFVPVAMDNAVALERSRIQQIAQLAPVEQGWLPVTPVSPVLSSVSAERVGEKVVYRAAGDHFLLVEYGEQVLDIRLRFRVHALMHWLGRHPLPGLRECTPGIRSLQLHYDSQQLACEQLIAHLHKAEYALNEALATLKVPSRIVHLPLSWDDEACHQAIEKYQQSVRSEAPWCPSNLEFIRRINGLDSLDEVKRIVFDAAYLVMGLGDVYLGAPVATPVDPSHRLVTTKYNPARTWTAENAVGIGGSYLCVYGMEGPGGYQFVGRTLQMWNRYRRTDAFTQPWLLRFFDQIRFYEVSHEELMTIREQFPLGRYPLRIETTEFSLTDYDRLVTAQAEQIARFRQQRQQAFEQELAHWHATGQFNFDAPEPAARPSRTDWPEGSTVPASPVSGSIWQVNVKQGEAVRAGQVLMVLESMKMEIPVTAPCDGVVTHVLQVAGTRVNAGDPLLVLDATSAQEGTL